MEATKIKIIIAILIFLFTGFLTGYALGYSSAIDFCISVGRRIVDIQLKPEILKDILLRYG